jgi:hypothetical protein
MTHSIEIWRAETSSAQQLLPLVEAADEAELPAAEEGEEAFIELCRQYPGLSRTLAQYLAR